MIPFWFTAARTPKVIPNVTANIVAMVPSQSDVGMVRAMMSLTCCGRYEYDSPKLPWSAFLT